MSGKIHLSGKPSFVTKVSVNLGDGAPSCNFSIRLVDEATTYDFHLNSSDPGLQGASGVLDRFYGMAQIVLAAFQNHLPFDVVSSEGNPELAVNVAVYTQPLANDDPLMTAFVGRVASSILINGEGAYSRQCEISFSPDDLQSPDCDPRTWNVNEPFSQTALALIAAVVSQGRVRLHRADLSTAHVSTSDGMTISIWAPGSGKKRS